MKSAQEKLNRNKAAAELDLIAIEMLAALTDFGIDKITDINEI